MRVFQNWALLLSTTLIVVGADQTTKLWVTRAGYQTIWSIGSYQIAALDPVYNSGMAFGISLGAHFPFFGLGLLASAALLTWFWKAKNLQSSRAAFFTCGLIIGGITGNQIDRLTQKAVIDFIALGFFPVFNLADLSLVSGTIILLLLLLLYPDKSTGGRL